MLATLALSALLLAAPPAPPAPPPSPAAATQTMALEQRVQDIYAEMAKMQKAAKSDGPMTKEQTAAVKAKAAELAAQALESVDLTKLDAAGIAPATTLCRMAGDKKLAELSAALAAGAKRPDAEGFAFAVAAVTTMPDGAEGSKEADAQSKAAAALLGHPGLKDGFAGPSARTFMMMLGECEDADLKPYVAQLKSLGASFVPDAPSEVFGMSTEWAKAMGRAAPGADAEAARVQVLGAVKERLAKATDEKKQKSLTRMAALLDGAAMRGALLGHPAPAMEITWLARTEGTPSWKTLADLKGKVVVLDFWATWCGPCVGSFPNVRAMRAKYSPEDVEIVGITSAQGYVAHKKRERADCKDDVAKEQAELATFMKDMEMTWTVAMTKEDVFNPDFAIRGIPFVAIIDADGNVAKVGLHPSNEEGIQKAVDELVAKKNAGKKG
jgi:thiol-disulfide isomerase/thioredoxin